MLKSCAGPVIRHSPLSLSSFVIRASSFLLAMSLPFKKVLIANRGEVALRIIRACRELGVPSALVYSEADRDSLPVLIADEAVCIGPSPAPDSYTNVSRILSAAEITKADALHPGYGFLSESPEFIEATESCKMVFIGPTVAPLRLARDRSCIAATRSRRARPGRCAPVSEWRGRRLRPCGELALTRSGYPYSSRLGAGRARGVGSAAGNTDIGQARNRSEGQSEPRRSCDAGSIESTANASSRRDSPSGRRKGELAFLPTHARSSLGTETCWRTAPSPA